MEEMLKDIYDKVNIMGDKFSVFENNIGIIKEDVGTLKEEMSEVKEEVDLVKKDTKSIHVTLENVTNRNISIIAENHVDIMRKLDEVIAACIHEKEIYRIRFNLVEDRVKRLGDQMQSIV